MTASAVNVVDGTNNSNYILPFPSPFSFGDSSKSVVLFNPTQNRFIMFTLVYQLGSFIGDSSAVTFDISCHNNGNSWNFCKLTASCNYPFGEHTYKDSDPQYVVASCQLYRFAWVLGSSSYSVNKVTLTDEVSGSTNGKIYFHLADGTYSRLSYTYGNSSLAYDWDCSYTIPFNGMTVSPLVSSSVSYSFSSTDGGAILSVLSHINSSLDSVDTGIDNVNNKLNSTNDLLNSVNNNVVFYCQQILERLDNGSDYVTEQPTSNSDLSDYAQAEGVLMDDNIQALNDMSLPDLNSFNTGKQGNAFQFISSNIEFFSGMNGSGSISKVGSVLLVVLGLGLTSFIIGLSNRKKGS